MTKFDLNELRRLLAKPCCDECVVKAMRNALPALLAEAEAGAELARVVAPLVADRDVGADAMRVLLRGGLREYDAAVGGGGVMRCCCDDVGPELMKCPRCGYPMAPVGRSVSAYMGGYCNCEERLWDDADATELHAFLRSVQKRSGLWPGERWGDSLPCIGDVCVAVAKKDDDECSGDMKADDAYLIRKFADA